MKNTNKLVTAAEGFFGMVGVVMILVETYAVMARNVLHTPVPWCDEALKLMFVWCIYICSALAFLSDDLISLTLLEDSLKEKGKMIPYNLMKAIQYVIAIIINGALFTQLLTIIQTQMSTGETTTVIQYPLWILNCGMLIGVTLTVVMAVFKLIGCFKSVKN